MQPNGTVRRQFDIITQKGFAHRVRLKNDKTKRKDKT